MTKCRDIVEEDTVWADLHDFQKCVQYTNVFSQVTLPLPPVASAKHELFSFMRDESVVFADLTCSKTSGCKKVCEGAVMHFGLHTHATADLAIHPPRSKVKREEVKTKVEMIEKGIPDKKKLQPAREAQGGARRPSNDTVDTVEDAASDKLIRVAKRLLCHERKKKARAPPSDEDSVTVTEDAFDDNIVGEKRKKPTKAQQDAVDDNIVVVGDKRKKPTKAQPLARSAARSSNDAGDSYSSDSDMDARIVL